MRWSALWVLEGTRQATSYLCWAFGLTLLWPAISNTFRLLPESLSCSQSRQTLNSSWGFIADGPSNLNYTQDTHCEWLILASSEQRFISLIFRSMATECSYDYVFVFDGADSSGKLLGSFSGETLPPMVYASSGSMFILFFSDTNYALQGFSAEYSLTACPHNCSGHGECGIGGACRCDELWAGPACSVPLCPDKCWAAVDRGRCEKGPGGMRCICQPGFGGDDCSLDDQNYVGNTWSLVSRWLEPGRLPARTAHSTAYHFRRDALFVYGGYDLNRVLSDLWMFSFADNSWKALGGAAGSSIDSAWLPVKTLEEEEKRLDLIHDSTTLEEDIPVDQEENRIPSEKEGVVGVRGDAPFEDAVEEGDGEDDEEEYQDENRGGRMRPRLVDDQQEGKRLNKLTNDDLLLRVDRSTSADSEPRTDRPPELQGHTMIVEADFLLLFGGKMGNGSLSNQLWQFLIPDQIWRLVATDSPVAPLPRWQHCMVATGEHFYIFGGSSTGGRILPDIYRMSLRNVSIWEQVNVRSGKRSTMRLTGHSCIYYEKTNSIVVFGGIQTDVPKFSKLSDKIYLLSLKYGSWSEVAYPRPAGSPQLWPPEMAFHTAAQVASYMIVYGGYTHKHNRREVCYSAELYFYHLDCHVWVSSLAMEHRPPGTEYPLKHGLYGHTVVTRNASQLIIVGGYHGTVSGDVLSFTVPSTLWSRETPCHLYGRYNACSANPKCGWCGSSGTCHRNIETFTCKGNLHVSGCPGVCPTMTDCHSCTTHGSKQCLWCVESRRCYDKNGLYQCPRIFPNRLEPWWGDSAKLASPESCTASDFRPGLTVSRFEYPANLSLPDHVDIVNTSKLIFTSPKPSGRRELDLADESQYMVHMRGIIHPVRNPNARLVQVRACVGQASASLMMSSRPPMEELVEVANLSHPSHRIGMAVSSPACESLVWTDKKPVFLYPTYAYPFSLKAVRNTSNAQKFSMISLEEESSFYKMESLEPYRNGSCSPRHNCQSCLEDSSCGWCHSSGRCHRRSEPSCPDFLVIGAEQCSSCSEHVECETCLTAPTCDWLLDEFRCVRKGRFAPDETTVTAVSGCPAPCHTRMSCASCLEVPASDCVWCQETATCFSFAVYTSEFKYGNCKSWLDSSNGTKEDENSSLSEQLCSSCSAFTNCSSCLQQLSCGWCYSEENPTLGYCTDGNFLQPKGGTCSSFAHWLFSELTPLHDSCANNRSCANNSRCANNNSCANNSSCANNRSCSILWAYAGCPDINECSLGLASCHPDADCVNLAGSYNCSCRRGFLGDGFSYCNKTCEEMCVHGSCSGHPAYQCLCDVGWTGSDCSTDCGCHQHSSCLGGRGHCDACQHHTAGPACASCVPGSFGNATSPTGCEPCQCNGHEDSQAGTCDAASGHCYCLAPFAGKYCELCAEGYFGEAANGGNCHHDCSAKALLTADSGIIGAVHTPRATTRECVWVVSALAASDELTLENIAEAGGQVQPTNTRIQLSVSWNSIKVRCEDNAVYVYDGLPPFLGEYAGSRMLASLCTEDIQEEEDIQLEATSSILTIYYTEDPLSSGFNASYRVLPCCDPDADCRVSRGDCACASCTRDGERESDGVVLMDTFCPNNCSGALNQGVCDGGSGECSCAAGYHGPDCSNPRRPYQIMSERLGDKADVVSRAGHSLLQDYNSVLWLFGGLHPDRGLLQDVRAFDMKTERFKIVNIVSSLGKGSKFPAFPPPRYFHAGAYSPPTNSFYIHAGLNLKSQLTDFWRFDIGKLQWTELQTTHKRRRSVRPEINAPWSKQETLPGYAGHTLTYLPATNSLLLIGGYSLTKGLNSQILEYDMVEGEWLTVTTSGFGPGGIYGHTATYSQDLGVILVFGGLRIGLNQSEVSASLWSYHVASSTWSILPFHAEHSKAMYNRVNQITGRLFHVATLLPRYILFAGGKLARSSGEQEGDLLAFSLDCLHWIRIPAARLDTQYMRQQAQWLGEPLLRVAAGQAAADQDGHLFLIGGVRGQYQTYIGKVSLPRDLCQLFSRTGQDCLHLPGCDFCRGSNQTGGEDSLCSSNSIAKEDAKGRCDSGGLEQGLHCTTRWISQAERSCQSFRRCEECLAVWPQHGAAPIQSHCQWCHGCERGGRCLEKGVDCGSENPCYSHQRAIVESGGCPELECSAPDCELCVKEKCFWSRHITRSSRQRISLGEEGASWNCEKRSLLALMEKLNRTEIFFNESSPPLPCPARCHTYQRCDECVGMGGSEAGPHSCQWSTRLSRCMSPLMKPLACLGGLCGKVVSTGEDCPVACPMHVRCSQCLEHTRCGWCSLNQDSNTQGFCTQGQLSQPELGTCQEAAAVQHNSTIFPEPGSMSWHFSSCPPEDECSNGHHSCTLPAEICIDTLSSFRCECNVGYARDEATRVCVPQCAQTCMHGSCVAPDVCQCNFGYVGHSCEHECRCNGHSNCKGPDALDVCLQCQNSTTGAHCELCQTGYVGDPTSGGQCTPCTKFCSGHSRYCMSRGLVDAFLKDHQQHHAMPNTDQDDKVETITVPPHLLQDMAALSTFGPKEDAVCINCGGQTRGPLCQDCQQGHFRSSSILSEGCRPCFCNHHGDQCDPRTGGDCVCKNQTETDASICKKGADVSENCWRQQCAKCREFYIGDPSHGHQCFRSMVVEQDYCFDPSSGTECSSAQGELAPGQTLFLAVQPKFMNVDIRITVDVTQGEVNVLLSAESQMFLAVPSNSSSSASSHQEIMLDPLFQLFLNPDDRLVVEQVSPYLLGGEKKLEEELFRYRKNSSLAKNRFQLRLVESNQLKTFVALNHREEVLFVKGLRHRLVISVPEGQHDLRASKFYLIFQASKSLTEEPMSGNVFFRQDQLHIDLFVFFSVFFSCFFLFLSACIVLWKLKQLGDQRRARERQAMEMTIMARRPFATQDVVLVTREEEEEDGGGYFMHQYIPPPREKKERKWGHVVHPGPDATRLLPHPDTRFCVRAVTVEPTADGLAAVTSLLVDLPGDGIRLAVGCALTTRVLANKTQQH